MKVNDTYMKRLLILSLLLAAASSCAPRQENHGAGPVRTGDAAKAGTSYVDTVILRRGDFKRQTLSNGRIRAIRKSALGFGTDGIIARIYVSEGDRVTEGDTIAKLFTEDAETALIQAGNDMKKAKIEMTDVLIGFGYGTDTSKIPEEFIETAMIRSGYSDAALSLRRARHEMEGTVITAPFSGKIADIKGREYEHSPSGDFCMLIDDSSFEVEFPLLESEIRPVRKGMKVKVTPFNNPEKCYDGEIVSVNPTVDGKGQIKVTAYVSRPDEGMMDGMNVKTIIEETVPGQLSVPKSAVVIRDNKDVVFLYDGSDSTAYWTYVRIMMSNSERHVIEADRERLSSLSEGDAVIVSGNLNLAHKSKVSVRK